MTSEAIAPIGQHRRDQRAQEPEHDRAPLRFLLVQVFARVDRGDAFRRIGSGRLSDCVTSIVPGASSVARPGEASSGAATVPREQGIRRRTGEGSSGSKTQGTYRRKGDRNSPSSRREGPEGAGGGSGEIRTHGGVAPSAVFKTAALNRSATLPVGRSAAKGRDRRRVPAAISRLADEPGLSVRRPPVVAGRLGPGAVDLEELAAPAVDAHRGEPAAPDAAGVERQQVGAVDQAERRPVAEGDRHAGACAARARRTRREARRRGVGAVLASAKSSVPSAATKRMRVSTLSGEAQPRRRRPATSSQRAGSLPYITRQELARRPLAQVAAPPRRRARSVGRQVPLRHDAGVHHQPAVLVHGHAAACAASRATPRGRARRGCRRGCRCGAAAARRAATASRCQSWLPSRQVADVAEAAQAAQRRRATPGRG